MLKAHSFHIPVMGIGFTIDTPVRVSQYGIDSVISLVDDRLLEKLRKMYCSLYGLPYFEISEKAKDPRAERITSYLNLIKSIAEKKFEELKHVTIEKVNDVKAFFHMLPDSSDLKQEFKALTAKYFNANEIRNWIKDKISMGSIDVNIMTKADRTNYLNDEKLPPEYSDAQAALRGFANSDLSSSIIFSAGMNPRLYSYLENFEDFYPDSNARVKKKIVLKVSDYRSALIQGKFLAKKGLWVSEYRIESGLNCGGHAFATDGFLMGPILAEFRDNRDELIQTIHELYVQALSDKNRPVPENPLPISISAQGGVGTAEEHQFLLDHYEVDSVGWGTPFLLVPEVTNVDETTLEKLKQAKEEDLYLSNISPLGVPFNNLRGNSKDDEKFRNIEKDRPGSSCPKKYVALNGEFAESGLCTASRQYQHLKIKELDKEELPEDQYNIRYEKIVEKACICVGLGTSALLVNELDTKTEGVGVSICPGPNMAYFSKVMTLSEITDHIYGRTNVISRTDRPNMFIKELHLYFDYLKNILEETKISRSDKQIKYISNFINNLKDGVNYYQQLFTEEKQAFPTLKSTMLSSLTDGMAYLNFLDTEVEKISVAAA